MKEKIRPIYSELQGYLSQAPPLGSTYLRDPALPQQFHVCIDELNKITGQDYNRFKVAIYPDADESYIRNTEYRSKINGLIMNLHAQYFNEEQSPFSGGPSTIFQQSQTQSQTAQAQIVMLLDFQNLINEKYNKAINNDEKSFFEDIKSKLSNVKNIAELIQLLIMTAKTFGLTIDQLIHIFR